jgi:hypothetical protein
MLVCIKIFPVWRFVTGLSSPVNLLSHQESNYYPIKKPWQHATNKARIIEIWSAMFSYYLPCGIRVCLINNQNGMKDQS